MVFGFDTEIKRRTGTDGKTCGLLYKASLMKDFKIYASCMKEDIHKAVCCMENLSGYMRGVRLTKGGR